MAVPALTFDIQEPGLAARRITTSGSVLKIGRGPKLALGLDDDTVSRMHAVIEVTEDAAPIIIDLGSEPQTVVNGARIHKAELSVGDQIQIGQSTLSLLSIGAFDVAAAAPPAQTTSAFVSAANAGARSPANPWRWDDPTPPRSERRPSWTLVFILLIAFSSLLLYTLSR